MNVRSPFRITDGALRRLNVVLIVAIIVMVNLVAGNAFFKLDLTANDAYSLSRVSRDTLARLEDPLRVKVFYTPELPAPYNGVRQYLTDLLREYDAEEGRYFSWEEIDPTTPEGRQEAQQYGLQQVEIQEIRSDEFQSRAVYMGAVVLYGNVVERIDRIGSSDGLEYRLTEAISAAVTQVDALAGSTEGVTMEVFASPALEDLQIQGFSELEAQMAAIHERVNRDNYGRVEFSFHRPDSIAEIRRIGEEYGIRPIRWEDSTGTVREGLLEVVLRQGERIERIPFEIYSQLFGGYTLDDPENIEDSLRRGIRSLVAANPTVAYAVGHGEKALEDNQRGAAPFAALAGERYEMLPVRLDEDGVPAGIDTLVINGPTRRYSEEALYRIDQFVMNGGSLFVLLDSHTEIIPSQQQQMQGAQPTWEPLDTGLDELLAAWGVEMTDQFILDEESYIARQPQGSVQLFQAPVLSGESLNRELPVTAGLQDVIVLNTTELIPARESGDASAAAADDGTGDDSPTAAADDGTPGAGDDTGDDSPTPGRADAARYIPLLRSSSRSWTAPPVEVGPWVQGAPATADLGRRDIAVLLEGRFDSYFDEPVDLGIAALGDADGGGMNADGTSRGAPQTPPGSTDDESGSDVIARSVETDRFLEAGIDEARIVVIGSSAMTTAQLLDPEGRSPNGTLLMNVLDYLNGAAGVAELRSKGLGVPRIVVMNPASVPVARWGNTVLVPALVVVIGIVVWQRRRRRSRRIQELFASPERPMQERAVPEGPTPEKGDES
ncbi:MAG: Gldg family protein [Alkalispirochaeta sp.]